MYNVGLKLELTKASTLSKFTTNILNIAKTISKGN